MSSLGCDISLVSTAPRLGWFCAYSEWLPLPRLGAPQSPGGRDDVARALALDGGEGVVRFIIQVITVLPRMRSSVGTLQLAAALSRVFPASLAVFAAGLCFSCLPESRFRDSFGVLPFEAAYEGMRRLQGRLSNRSAAFPGIRVNPSQRPSVGLSRPICGSSPGSLKPPLGG
jgi:hypothetical protein